MGQQWFATASTGTAISSLSGVAATNATLAWFGGGALSAGGLGMAGGVAVLGGIVAAPVLALSAGLLAAKARENLANAKTDHALAEKHARELDAARVVVEGIRKAANLSIEVVSETVERMQPVLGRFAAAITQYGTNFERYPEDAKRDIYLAVQFAQCLKAMLEVPILTRDGGLNGGHRKAIEESALAVPGHRANA